MIIKWPLNGQFRDARDVISTSRTDVREMVDDNNDDEWPLVIYIYIYIVGCRGASQLRGSLLGIPPGYKADKL